MTGRRGSPHLRWSALGIAVCLIGLLVGCTLLNESPVARIEISPEDQSGPSPHTVAFDGSTSFDPDGILVAFDWDFGDGETASGEVVGHTYLATAATKRFTVTLTVTDDRGATSSATQSIEVLTGGGGTPDANGEGDPVPWITASKLIGLAGLKVTFDAAGSTGGAGNIIEYDWDFGDGTTAVGARVTHEFDPEETEQFTVTLFVWNDRGAMGLRQIEIIAIVPEGDTGDEEPTAELTVSDPEMIYESEGRPDVPSLFRVSFDPRGSTADAGHQIEYYLWEYGDGEFEVKESDLEVIHIYELPSETRTYIARLTVYDDQGLEDETSVNITLTDPFGPGDMEEEDAD
jgi:PKD repeat protein